MSKKSNKATEQRNLVSRLQSFRGARKEARVVKKRQRQTEKARLAKAKNEAIKDKAMQRVQDAVDKSYKRKSRPLLIFILMGLTIGLSGAFVWQYRDNEVLERDTEIVRLEARVQELTGLEDRLQAQAAAEEARFETVLVDGFTLRMPVEWREKPSQYPATTKVYGDNIVSLQVITNSPLNSLDVFIPEVDYIWRFDNAGQNPVITAKSLHCERFDTLSNDLDLIIREHQGFNVFCDDFSERVIIFAAGSPESYGSALPTDTYFIYEIADFQQTNLDELESVLTSYEAVVDLST